MERFYLSVLQILVVVRIAVYRVSAVGVAEGSRELAGGDRACYYP